MKRRTDTTGAGRDVTVDLLLCNRCGTCRFVCPLLDVLGEEWAGPRGKVELAEAFFKGEKIDEGALRKIFDLCLHCQTCEENCPSGMRADEIVMAVRSEMARRGKVPIVKRLSLRALEGMNGVVFKLARTFGFVRRGPLHGAAGGGGVLIRLYPLLGWKRERLVPYPARRTFLGSSPELMRAADAKPHFPDVDDLESKASDVIARVARARERNLAEGRRAFFYVGHAVNQFFPEEAEAVARLLNTLGVDVLAPHNQTCCGAPTYFSGDIDGARRIADRMLQKFAGHRYDWIVTSCSSGGHMLKAEIPRLFDFTADGYFEIAWDGDKEGFVRKPRARKGPSKERGAETLYREYVDGRVRDVNELVAELLGLKKEAKGLGALFGEGAGSANAEGAVNAASAADSPEASQSLAADPTQTAAADRPIITYHHPCHLRRGQKIDWQPEAILAALPGYRYVPMKDADRCCGGGGAFTFFHEEEAEAVARRKMDAIEKLMPAVVATACPACRIQLMDMMNRRFVVEREKRGKAPMRIRVAAPAELLLEEIAPILGVDKG